MNAIFRCGAVVIRVATPTAPAARSLDLAAALACAAIPVASAVRPDVVEHDGMSATAWEFIESTGAPVDWRAVGEIVRAVHELGPNVVPAGVPLPSPAAFPWWDFEQLFAEVASAIDDAALDGLRAAVERQSGWAGFDETVLCHGDVHPGNVMMAAEGPVLIDWDLLCRAPRGWDHAPMMTWTSRWGGEHGVYDAFAAGYGWSGRGDGPAEAFAELRLVAATLMRVKAGIADPTARPEADRRLAWWRGEPDAPIWRAQ